MAIYAICFDIAAEGNADERYQSLVSRIVEAGQDFLWQETPYFFIISSKKKTEQLAYDLHVKSRISTVLDKLLVINLSRKAHAVRCNIETLAALNAGLAQR